MTYEKTGVVLDIRCVMVKLAAGLDALDQDRLQHGRGSIDQRQYSPPPRNRDEGSLAA